MSSNRKAFFGFALLFSGILAVTACAPAPKPTVTAIPLPTAVALDASTVIPTATGTATATPTSTTTATPTPSLIVGKRVISVDEVKKGLGLEKIVFTAHQVSIQGVPVSYYDVYFDRFGRTARMLGQIPDSLVDSGGKVWTAERIDGFVFFYSNAGQERGIPLLYAVVYGNSPVFPVVYLANANGLNGFTDWRVGLYEVSNGEQVYSNYGAATFNNSITFDIYYGQYGYCSLSHGGCSGLLYGNLLEGMGPRVYDPIPTVTPFLLRNIAPKSFPMTGTYVPQLAAYDQAMWQFMRDRNIQAGTLAVMRNGVVVLVRGYGWQDRTRTKPILPNALMRLASVDKPITAAAIKKLIGEGHLSSDTKVFPFLGITPPPGQTADPRLNSITIQQLLDQSSGLGGNETWVPTDVVTNLSRSGSLDIEHIARYIAGQPLLFAPGASTSYSNYGYDLLRWVVERASGGSLIAYLQKEFGMDVGCYSCSSFAPQSRITTTGPMISCSTSAKPFTRGAP
jgi:hypothetical protein